MESSTFLFAFLLSMRSKLAHATFNREDGATMQLTPKQNRLFELRSELLRELAGEVLDGQGIRWRLHAESNRRGWLLQDALPRNTKKAKRSLALVQKVEERVRYLEEIVAELETRQAEVA
jgi:hypothetical protein